MNYKIRYRFFIGSGSLHLDTILSRVIKASKTMSIVAVPPFIYMKKKKILILIIYEIYNYQELYKPTPISFKSSSYVNSFQACFGKSGKSCLS